MQFTPVLMTFKPCPTSGSSLLITLSACVSFPFSFYPSTLTLQSVKKAKGRTPASLDYLSRPSSDEGLKEQTREARKDHKEAKSQVSRSLI
jgi:hypothetical protein